MAYSFSTLSWADFEDLARDLIGLSLGCRFESFAPGPDGGMDGRSTKNGKTVLQAKHYLGSTLASLKSTLRAARPSIELLDVDRYILATSRPITAKNKEALSGVIGPASRGPEDIFGPQDLNGLLRSHPEVEKAHIKLWLSSAPVLERVLRSAAHTFTAMSKADIDAKVKVYAPNPSFQQSREKLESTHVVIISGPPGVGKTTLAEMLAYTYVGEEWELVAIRSLEDGLASIVDSRKQLFLFDDFLGKVALDQRALAAKDSDIARFIARVRRSPNSRFILTTRAYIFDEARRVSEHLADRRLDINKFVLDVGVYTRRIRARILYNHLIVARTPRTHVARLIESGHLPAIIDHKNYNPRVIEWMTDALHASEVSPELYVKTFIETLSNPHQLWDTAFRSHISRSCQHLLFALHFSSQYGAKLGELRVVFEYVHQALSAKYGVTSSPKDFEEALHVLEGGFISIAGGTVTFINPSLRDYLNQYLDDPDLFMEFAKCSPRASWAREVWRKGKMEDNAIWNKEFAQAFKSVAKEFVTLPGWRPTPVRDGTLQRSDLDAYARITLLVEWWDATRDKDFAQLALAVAKGVPGGVPPWSLRFIASDVTFFRSGLHGDFPNVDEMVDALERIITGSLESGLAFDDLDSLADEIESHSAVLSEGVLYALDDAIVREVEAVQDYIIEMDSESELEDQVPIIRRLAGRANIPSENVERAVAFVKSRIDDVLEQTLIADSPESRGDRNGEAEAFGDDELTNLFAPLLHEP